MKDAMKEWANGFKRYMAAVELATDSCIVLFGECVSIGEQLARPTPGLVNGLAKFMHGSADIATWAAAQAGVLTIAARGFRDNLKASLDKAGAPTVEDATNMLNEAMKESIDK